MRSHGIVSAILRYWQINNAIAIFILKSTFCNLNRRICRRMKKFAFASDAAEREYKDFSKEIQQQFGTSLRAIQDDKKPFLPIQPLESIGAGVIELKINGSPAFRCVYIAKFLNTVFVLHSFEKTTNGVDRKAMKTVQKRYKELKSELDNMKKQK
jgi:phage-related protein